MIKHIYLLKGLVYNVSCYKINIATEVSNVFKNKVVPRYRVLFSTHGENLVLLDKVHGFGMFC